MHVVVNVLKYANLSSIYLSGKLIVWLYNRGIDSCTNLYLIFVSKWLAIYGMPPLLMVYFFVAMWHAIAISHGVYFIIGHVSYKALTH